MSRLTATGLHIASAITLFVQAHSLETLVWSGPRGCAAYSYTPGPLPDIALTGDLRHSADPILLDHKSEPGPRWFGSYSRVWFDAEDITIDFGPATYGAHVVWTEKERTPSLICGGPRDWNFDGETDADDIRDFMVALIISDHRADWNEDGVADFFDLLGYMEGQ